MSDDLDALKAALQAATPAPDQDARQVALRLSMENYDRLQGSADPERLSSSRAPAAGSKGVWMMLKAFAQRPGFAAATSALAITVALTATWPLLTRGPILPQAPLTPAEPIVAPLASTETDASPAQTAATSDKLADQPLAQAEPAPAAAASKAASTAAPKLESRDTMQAQGNAAAEMTTVESFAADSLSEGEGGAEVFASGPMLAAPMSATPDVPSDMTMALPEPNTEAFANAAQNPVHVTAEAPVSTFSADVDTASYAFIRSSLNTGYLPPPEAVRVEEMVNYFPYAYAAPEGDQPIAAHVAVMPTPWNAGTRLVRIGLQGQMPALADRPALNLVFLIDTSGSMEDSNKLPLLKQSLRLLLPRLSEQDRVAIVTYAGSAGQVLPPTPAQDRAAISAALDRLDAGGATAGAEGIALAYQVARSMQRDGAIGRVVLATDGDFNLGIADPEQLTKMIAAQRDSGIYLSVLGFGRGNLDDATMQALAQNGNGTAAYIDTMAEAQKVLGDQLTGALFPIANDVKIQVEWNPAQVAEYRLIGYETRSLRREDFNNDRIDAGEVGAGLQVTALYEITAPGSPALRNDPLRYAAVPQVDGSGELGFLRLRWKAPGQAVSHLAEVPIQGDEPADAEARFAAAVAGFGQLLQGAPYLGDWGWDQAIALAQGAKGEDPYGYRAEAVTLMRLAASLSR